MIRHRERTLGLHPHLLAFLDWWDSHGEFAITIPPDGGLRTDEARQAMLYKLKASNAQTLADTPHGRGAAVDFAPFINGTIPWKDIAKFRIVGLAGEAFGLEWGGAWVPSFKYPQRRPDFDHLQLRTWRDLPFPPTPITNT